MKQQQQFFRSLNKVVEPAVRRGLFSAKCVPTGLISLETIGFKSGLNRRTPLLANTFAGYTLVSTVRGGSSFWVKNLIKQPEVSFSRAGKLVSSRAIVITRDSLHNPQPHLPAGVRWLVGAIAAVLPARMAVAVLVHEA